MLGYVIDGPECFDEIRLILGDNPEVFSNEDCRDVYQAMLQAKENGRPTDEVGIYGYMKRPDAVFLGHLSDFDNIRSPYHAPQRAREVIDWHRGDLIAKISSQAILDASSGTMGGDKIAKMMSDLSKLTERTATDGLETLNSAISRVIKDIDARRKDANQFNGIPTGMPDYDRLMNGLMPNTMNVIAARPGVGKSALAVNIARNCALLGYPVLFFSLEMDIDDLAKRFVSIECDTSYEELSSNVDVHTKNDKLRRAVGSLSPAKVTICDSEKTDIHSFCALSRKFAAKNQPNMPVIIMDYLQLCKMPDNGKKNRYEVVGEATRSIKQLSRELKCPIVLLSQLSREADDATEPFRCNQYLRESGNIEQDADTITIMLAQMEKRMFEFYKKLGYAEGQIVNCALTKNRRGKTGRCNMYFEKETQFIIPAKNHTLRYGEERPEDYEEEPF